MLHNAKEYRNKETPKAKSPKMANDLPRTEYYGEAETTGYVCNRRKEMWLASSLRRLQQDYPDVKGISLKS